MPRVSGVSGSKRNIKGNSKRTDPRDQRVEYFLQKINEARSKLVKHSLPPDRVCEVCIRESLNSRNGRLLANSPTFRERPLASVFHRMLCWHRGNGFLGTIFTVQMDCGLIIRFDSESSDWGDYWKSDKSQMLRDHNLVVECGYTDEKQLFEDIDTLVQVCLMGTSTAMDKWKAALGL